MQAVEDGHERVVAVGGDGTANQVAGGLWRAGGGTLGVVPLGTGNDIARTLGVPLDWRRAAAVVSDGRRREVDLVKIGDHVVLNAIGVGLLGDISARAARIKVIRGLAAYAIRHLPAISPALRAQPFSGQPIRAINRHGHPSSRG